MTWRLGGHLLEPLFLRGLRAALAGRAFDLCHVDCGEWVTRRAVSLLKAHAGQVINYCIDDPTGPRDGARFKAYRQAVSSYDLVVVMRPSNVEEVHRLGARQVLRVFMSADEVSHAPRPITEQDRQRWQSEVLFLGTWMPERGPFLLQLMERGVPLSIRGSHWEKAPQWPQLQRCWRGGAVSGDDYAMAIQCASINLGMLSKGNRDLHTTRTMEVPALAGLLCAERTAEHTGLYQEGVEAVFWRDAAECAQLCHQLLSNPLAMQRLAHAGHQRYLASPHRNEAVMQRILQTVDFQTVS
ncbi:MAG: glycosyltransferase [Acidobacteriota bacterium]